MSREILSSSEISTSYAVCSLALIGPVHQFRVLLLNARTQPSFDQTDDGVDTETSLSLSLHVHLSSPPLHFFLALTIGHYILFENACELQRVVFHLEELTRTGPVFISTRQEAALPHRTPPTYAATTSHFNHTRPQNAPHATHKFRVLLLNARTQPSFDQTDDGVDTETSLSLSLHVYLSSPPLHFFLALTIGHYILFENACELQRVVFHLEELTRTGPVFISTRQEAAFPHSTPPTYAATTSHLNHTRPQNAPHATHKFRVLLLNACTQPSFDQTDDGVDAETSFTLSLFMSISLLRL